MVDTSGEKTGHPVPRQCGVLCFRQNEKIWFSKSMIVSLSTHRYIRIGLPDMENGETTINL